MSAVLIVSLHLVIHQATYSVYCIFFYGPCYRKLRSRDASKFHVQLSLSLLCMLVVFVVGIDRTEVLEGCVTVSVLIHYFTLVAVMWMGAEAVLMFQKLVVVFVSITTRYIIIVSLVCWCKEITNLFKVELHAMKVAIIFFFQWSQ